MIGVYKRDNVTLRCNRYISPNGICGIRSMYCVHNQLKANMIVSLCACVCVCVCVGVCPDVANRRLYWVDSKLHLIASVDLNGAHRRTHLASAQTLGQPYALAVFEVGGVDGVGG